MNVQGHDKYITISDLIYILFRHIVFISVQIIINVCSAHIGFELDARLYDEKLRLIEL